MEFPPCRPRVSAAATYDSIDPDNASILVCGGGGVALSVTRKLKNMGSWVWQLQRTDVRRKEIESMMAIVAKGDALNKADVQKTFDSESYPSPASHPPRPLLMIPSLTP
jgi:shikimate 5-dehydrogenase